VRSHVINDSEPCTTSGCHARRWESERSRLESQRVPGRGSHLVGTFEEESGSLLLMSFSPDTTFTCLFCHHDNSVNVRVDRKEGVALLVCKTCDQRYQSKVNRESSPAQVYSNAPSSRITADLTEPIDIYSEWIDAADAAQNDPPPRRPTASSSRAQRAAAPASDDD
jgi:transcription elongation factor Elf1